MVTGEMHSSPWKIRLAQDGHHLKPLFTFVRKGLEHERALATRAAPLSI